MAKDDSDDEFLALESEHDQPSTTGIDVNVIELTEQNAEDPWKMTEVKKFMTSESEAKTVLYKKTAEYLDGGIQRNLEGDAPEPLKPLSTKEISEIKLQANILTTRYDQNEVLRVFVSDFAGQSIYYDTHGCFVKPHCPYVLVHDISLEFDDPAVPRFKASKKEEEIEMTNPHRTTNLDNFTSWLKFLQGLGECQDQQFPNKSGDFTTAKGENFKLPPVLIALTKSDKVKGNDGKIDCVQNRINEVLSGGKYANVFPEFFLIDNTLEGDDGDDVQKLRRKLFDLSNAVLNQEILMPVKWLDFEVALSLKLSPDCKYIPVDEAKQEAEACGVGEFDHAIKFLHRQGVVVHHSGSRKVVLDPHWLMNRFTKVISMPGKLDALARHPRDMLWRKGILFREYLQTLEDAELLEELMQKFNLICSCQHDGKAAFYVPSVAPAMIPGKELEASNVPSLFVTFPRKHVPMGLFTKLQVRFISEWRKRFPNQQATPSFYCNYSLLPLIIDNDVYEVCLIDLHEFIKVAVFPKQDGNHFKFASHVLATLKKCLDDLKSPDQLLFSMTSYDLEVECTCCFGKEERKCSRHHEIQCDSDRCGHRHFWKLSDLQRFYNDKSRAVCWADKRSAKVFDIKSVKIWLNTVPDVAMVEDSSNLGRPNETSSEASSPGNDRIAPPPELNITLPTARDFDSEPYDWSSSEIQSQLPTDILLITANDHEFNACYSYMKHVQRSYFTKLGMVDFGRFGDQNNPNVRVALIKCRQGQTDAVIVVRNAAEILNPKVVLFVGICASMERAKAKLGDVVISAKLETYDHKKFKADGTVEYRGTKPDVSRNVARLILNATDGWKPPLKDPTSLDVEVHNDAVMLSGSDLVNNRERRQELLNSFPDALGLEMDGAGLYAAVYDLGIEWAVIKAVSDFADGSKEKTKLWQPFASAMAASVVYNMFKYPVVLKDWRHYNAEGHT
ncbi:5 -methylthioadenosine S-adenosylhomocysteine nucleosidase-like isoform X16 [Paramuricea clavata]|uniref:5 -methylthioadenosine S-adenosylhomocysteine nucleosidase-like isoform X16 n=1 Tax=Paramuricea clavata TaxID=317549 RepID=A0A7D9JIN3_PARCT|nr:5 -methylthioadenosine S-adenosylhomocysteine nucleosidase-like isoform X16 [Paramuricea clavata]